MFILVHVSPGICGSVKLWTYVLMLYTEKMLARKCFIVSSIVNESTECAGIYPVVLMMAEINDSVCERER